MRGDPIHSKDCPIHSKDCPTDHPNHSNHSNHSNQGHSRANRDSGSSLGPNRVHHRTCSC